MNIAELIQKIADTGEEIYSQVGVVRSVNMEKATCEVHPLNGDAPIMDVRFHASLDPNMGFIPVPQVGSKVVVCFLDKQSAFIAQTSELEKLRCHLVPLASPNPKLTLEMNEKGLLSQVEGNTMLTEISAWEDEIKLLAETTEGQSPKKIGFTINNEGIQGGMKSDELETSLLIDHEQLDLSVKGENGQEAKVTVKSESLTIFVKEGGTIVFDKENGFVLDSKKGVKINAAEDVAVDAGSNTITMSCETLNVNDVLTVKK